MSSARSVLRPDRPLLVTLVVATAVVTLWLFVPTMSGHIATMNVGSVDVTVTEYAVSDGGEHLSVTLEVHNPTRRAVVFYSGLLHAADGRAQLSDGTTTGLGETTVPPGGTVEITANIDLAPERASRARRAVESGSVALSGKLRGEIGNEGVTVPVDIAGSDR